MICIVTVYNSLNMGSFLQAEALYDYLSSFDEVVFLDTHSRSPLKKTIRAITKELLKLHPQKISLEVAKYRYFKTNLKKFRIVSLKECAENTIFIFGSDEIWNISRSQMSRYPIFWGHKINGIKIAYAPSINRTTENDLINWPYTNELNNFKAIGVRDKYSKYILQKFCKKSISQVVDPTMLFTAKHFKKDYIPVKEKYIAIYMFEGRTSSKHIALLKSIAEKLNLILVGVGAQYDWCDRSFISSNSFDYFDEAEYTIVNTFHGTIFSILYNKQFLCFADSQKVNNLLSDFSLEERISSTFDVEKETERLLKPIDFNTVNSCIDKKREESTDYLKKAIGIFGSSCGEKEYDN